jgi:tetraacyldisaccharide 4'-kinase
MKRLDYYWYNKSPVSLVLTPVSWLYCLLAIIRSVAYQFHLIKTQRLPVPVIIVGNITAGGTGKTPMVTWLVDFLRKQGYTPGIVSRGYGGGARSWPQQVRVDSDPRMVGDEAILLARRCQCPMAVGPARVEAAQALLTHTDCDIIVADDGLQHYALERDVEIAVIDGVRRFGNGKCLPAGPLREPRSRIRTVDIVITNGVPGPREYRMTLKPGMVQNLANRDKRNSLSSFKGKKVHAIAGIGNPERFFTELEEYGIEVVPHDFPDHYLYTTEDVNFNDDLPVLMTEKDAVKCTSFADERHWFVPVDAQVDERISPILLRLIGHKNG